MAIMFEPKTFNYKSEDLPRTSTYPRLRYMGSKYKIAPYLTSILSDISFESALDAFSGSGVVSGSVAKIYL